MQRLLSLKLASTLPKKLSHPSSPLLCHQYKIFSTLSHTIPSTPQSPHFLFSNFTTTSLHSWLSQYKTTVSRSIHGFLSKPATVKQVLSKTHFSYRVPSKGLMGCKVLFIRAQFPWNSFVFNMGFLLYAWRSWLQRLPAADLLLGLLVANVAVFMLWRIADHNFMINNFMISLDNFNSGRVHTMITSAFSHITPRHLINNMIGLFVFGLKIGKVFGAGYLLKLYLAGAIGGSVFFLLHDAYMALTSKGGGPSGMDRKKFAGLGASGAVNAIMLLSIFLFPKSTIYVDFFIPVPATLLGIYLIGQDMLRIIGGDSKISGSAHLGGAVVAAIAWARIRRRIF